METEKKRKSNNITGVAGEYYVCAELCKKGYLALTTPKNNPIFDVVVTNYDGSKTVAIQVKTMSTDNKQGWKLNKAIDQKHYNDKLFVVLVNLLEIGNPEYYIYEHDILSEIIENKYKIYMSKPNRRNGLVKKDVGFRWHDFNDFTEYDYTRKNNWNAIIDKLN